MLVLHYEYKRELYITVQTFTDNIEVTQYILRMMLIPAKYESSRSAAQSENVVSKHYIKHWYSNVSSTFQGNVHVKHC